jgi:hypothetical protein
LASAHEVPLATLACAQPVAGRQLSVVHTLPSSQLGGVPAVHVPLWHVSAPLQAFPSAHDVPFATTVTVQPVAGTQLSVVQGLPSLQTSAEPAVQVPAWQVSVPLQRLVSAQEVPLVTFVCVQPVAGTQLSVVQTLLSLQLGGVPAVHVPLWHVSAPLQAFPSEHAVPFATTAFEQTPALQVSVVHGLPSLQSPGTTQGWQPEIGVFTQPERTLHESVVQALLSLQLSGVPAVQLPDWQVSAPLQTFPSAQAVPFATGVVVHPVAGTQLSVVQTLPSLQTSGVPALHAPPWQVSAPLQALPSVHDVPFATATCWQPRTGSQVSVVQGLLSLQLRADPGVQVPAWHVSAPLQTVPSGHAVPLETFACAQPVAGTQLSVVHTLLSSQLSGVPALHAPPWQVSAPLQALPSLHAVPFDTATCWQPRIGSQLSVVQGLLSLQLRAVPAVHVPPWQVSAPLQRFASAHDVPLVTLVTVQPVAALQPSVVQTLPSLQTSGEPAVQVPA